MKVAHPLELPGGLDLLDAKGDLVAASAADTPARLAVGANGKVLAADSAQATGLAWVDDHTILPYSVPGVLVTGARAVPFIVPAAMVFVDARLAVGTAPTGASIIVDVHKNGTTLYTGGTNRPTIAAGATSGAAGAPAVTALAAGDILTVEIDQVGSSVAGADLGIVMRLART